MALPNSNSISSRNVSIAAGIGLIVMTVAAIASSEFFYGNLVVPDDVGGTVENIGASPFLFRAGLFTWLIIILCDVLVAWALYIFFYPVNRRLSLLTAWLRFLYACILATAVSCLLFVCILSEAGFSSTAPVEQFHPMVELFIKAFNEIWNWGLFVFGIHLLLIGLLALNSVDVPVIMGLLVLLASSSYLIVNPAYLLFPQFSRIIDVIDTCLSIPAMGEIVFGIWLLIRGGKAFIRGKYVPEKRVKLDAF